MGLDPQVRDVLGAAADLPDVSELTPAAARRRSLDALAARRRATGPPEPVGEVRAQVLAGVSVRRYAPSAALPAGPVVAFFHGGGWVVGDLDTHDDVCRRLCVTTGATVVAVDYRLAPEHPFPAAVEDAGAVVRALAAAQPDAPLAVAGDSAGGNLAAVVALRCRDDDGPPLAAQALVYPVLDASMALPSYHENAEGYGLSARGMAWYWRQYAPADPADPSASPLAAADLTGAPPAVIATAGFDPLRDEGDAYAERLAGCGVAVTHLRYPTLVHSFLVMTPFVDAARAATTEVWTALAALLR